MVGALRNVFERCSNWIKFSRKIPFLHQRIYTSRDGKSCVCVRVCWLYCGSNNVYTANLTSLKVYDVRRMASDRGGSSRFTYGWGFGACWWCCHRAHHIQNSFQVRAAPYSDVPLGRRMHLHYSARLPGEKGGRFEMHARCDQRPKLLRTTVMSNPLEVRASVCVCVYAKITVKTSSLEENCYIQYVRRNEDTGGIWSVFKRNAIYKHKTHIIDDNISYLSFYSVTFEQNKWLY